MDTDETFLLAARRERGGAWWTASEVLALLPLEERPTRYMSSRGLGRWLMHRKGWQGAFFLECKPGGRNRLKWRIRTLDEVLEVG